MHGLCNKFLSCSGFAGDEHGGGVSRDNPDQRSEVMHGLTDANHAWQRHEAAAGGRASQLERGLDWHGAPGAAVNILKPAVGWVCAEFIWYIDFAALAIEKDDIRAWELMFDHPNELVAIQVRKFAVEHDDTRATALKHTQSFGSPAGFFHKGHLAQAVSKPLAQECVGRGDQDRCRSA
jgi:hypothetical protein